MFLLQEHIAKFKFIIIIFLFFFLQTFQTMLEREEEFRNNDAQHIAIRPYEVMDNITYVCTNSADSDLKMIICTIDD